MDEPRKDEQGDHTDSASTQQGYYASGSRTEQAAI